MSSSENITKLGLALAVAFTVTACDQGSDTQTGKAPAEDAVVADQPEATADADAQATEAKVVRVEAGPEVQDQLQGSVDLGRARLCCGIGRGQI